MDETERERLAQLLMASQQQDSLAPMPRNPAAPADWAQNAVVGTAGKLAGLLMAPRRAMDQGMTTEEAIPWAGQMALTMAGTGAPAAGVGAVGSAGGKLTQPSAQQLAQNLRGAGTDRQAFETAYASLPGLSKAELSELANGFIFKDPAASGIKFKTKDEALKSIRQTWVERARFENKLKAVRGPNEPIE